MPGLGAYHILLSIPQAKITVVEAYKLQWRTKKDIWLLMRTSIPFVVFFVLHDTKDDPKKQQYLVIDFLVSTQLARSASEKPNNYKMESLGNKRPRPGLPFKYLRTLQAELI